jgi:hypothetical protein
VSDQRNKEHAVFLVGYLAERGVDAHLSSETSIAIDIETPDGWFSIDLAVNGMT